MVQLYEKNISLKGKVTYQEYQLTMMDRDITENQALSLASLLTLNLLDNYKKQIPEHKRNARIIQKTMDCIKELLPNNADFDEEFATHIADCWNLAFMLMSKGAVNK
jgi:hypothetical protein